MGKKYVIEVEDKPYQDACGVELWKVENLHCYISKSELEKLEEYKEPVTHNFEVGDVCYLPEEFNNQKLIVTKIAPHMIGYMRSDGSTYAMLETRFKSGAMFLYHSKLFEDFLKGDFT